MTALASVTRSLGAPVHRDAIRDITPMVLAVAPLGLTIGATAAASPVNGLAGWLGGPLIVSGSVHLAVLSLLSTGASTVVVMLAALVIGARFAAYSAALSPAFVTQPTWFRLIGPYALVDQTFALASNRMHEDEAGFRRYVLVASGILFLGWIGAISAGMAVGPVIPQFLELWFVMPLLFTSLTTKAMVDRSSVASAVTAAVTALALSSLETGVGLTAAIFVGAIAGFLTRRTS